MTQLVIKFQFSSVSRLTQHVLLHYLGKTKQAKYYIFVQCNIII